MKKRIVSLLLTTVLLFGAVSYQVVPVSASEQSSTVFDTEASLDSIGVYSDNLLIGDVNLDGKLTSKDSMSLKKVVLGNIVPVSRFTSDVTSDGKINGKDLLVMKKYIAGNLTAVEYMNTTVEKAFDADEAAAKLTVSSVGVNEALFELSLDDVDTAATPYFAIVWKGAEAVGIGASVGGPEVVPATVEIVEGEEYSAAVAVLPDLSEYTVYDLEIKYDDAPTQAHELFVDSVIFGASEAEVKSFVDERLAARSPEPEAKYIRVDFDSTASAGLITATNNTAYYYDAGYDALKLQVSGSSADPWALVDVSSFNISADEYKYVVFTTQTLSSMNQPLPEGELFFSAGSIAGPTAGYSSIYSISKDSQYHSKIFEMTNASFWTGKVHSVRVDYFCACAVGDTQFVDSIVFCNTYEAAQAVCVNRETLTTDVRELFDYGLYHDGAVRIPYRIYVPYNYDSTKAYPVLTLLHGAGERGTNGTHQLTQGFPYLFDTTTNVAFSGIVIAPHCPEEYRWVEFYWGDANYSCNDVPESEPLKAVVKVLENLPNNYSVDEDRFYVSGMSMGGFGTWDLLSRHSDMFAAAVPLCGGGDTSKADILKDIPIHTFHGTSDNIVPLRGTTNMYNAIIAAGGTKITYTALGGMDHFIWDHVYQQDWVFDWLFQQNRADR